MYNIIIIICGGYVRVDRLMGDTYWLRRNHPRTYQLKSKTEWQPGNVCNQ